MSESFKPSKEKALSPEAKYEKLPPANHRELRKGAEQGLENFLFDPVTVNVIPEFLGDEGFLPKDEKSLFKLTKEEVSGEYEITCCSRAPGDKNRIDKMISELDVNNPWEPAKLEHLLFFRFTHPGLVPNGVVAFGTEERHHMPRLESDGKLTKHYRHGGFNNDIYFLIARRK